MTKEQFVKILENYKLINTRIHEYYEFGIDLIEVKHSPVEPIDAIINTVFSSVYNDLGIDWINWFMWENDFGKEGLEAFDDGKLICQTIEDLYDYVEKYKL